MNGVPDLELRTPWLNAAGTLGFAPPERWPLDEAPGAFVTNPVSLTARTPAHGRCLASFAGGFLLHSGLPNPGLNEVLRRYAPRWARSELPVWVHLLADRPEDVARMVRTLEEQDGVAAIELGLPPHAGPALRSELILAALGELPLVVNVPLTSAGEAWLGDLLPAGVSAISLGAPRGALPLHGKTPTAGRLYGPAIFPLALAAVRQAQNHGLPLIASGGVYSMDGARALCAAGAVAVQFDAVLWR